MLDRLLDEVLTFVARYGWVAVFVYMVLETSFILHFAPSEIVVPVAEGQLESVWGAKPENVRDWQVPW